MKKRWFMLIVALFAISAALSLVACASSPEYPQYLPEKGEGDGGFDFPSNSYSADIELDGMLDDARWQEEDVIVLGTWDDSDVKSGEYGAIVNDVNHYAETKRAVIRMFRGEVGFHFGAEVRDSDLAYLSKEDGDPAIWTDNILINLCTAIDGAEVPMSDDYYFIVTAFGNICFRRGSNAAGMWGAWNGVLDYESAIYYSEDGSVTGFGVELVVPYEQLGLKKDSPLGVTFRSCDRISATNSMIEREWFYNGGTHHFNTPNDYIVWGGDNVLYNYYDYPMPDISINGSIVDYVDSSVLEGVRISGVCDGETISAVTDENGSFKLENVNPNADIVFTAEGEALLCEQTFTVERDEMRVLNGGTLEFTAKLLSSNNTVTQTVRGVITTTNENNQLVPAAGAIVKMGNSETIVEDDGSYLLECDFVQAKMLFSVQSGNAFIEKEFDIAEALKGEIVFDAELPKMDLLEGTFGKGNAKTWLGWTSEGLYVRISGTGSTNGYGVAFDKENSDGQNGKVVLYHSFGTMCVTGFLLQDWVYAPPADFGVTAQQYTILNGENIYEFVVPYELIGIHYGESLRVAPFEYTSEGPFANYVDPAGNVCVFGAASALEIYPLLSADGTIAYAKKETVVSEYGISAFGKSQAAAVFELVAGSNNGVRVTISYTPQDSVFGFGIMFGNAEKTGGVTDLYAVGFGTVDHHVYGDWLWTGNYVPATQLGIVAEEKIQGERAIVTLFYSFDVLCGADYSLGIGANISAISLQMFEYVTDASGNLYGVYNCINDETGKPLAFDTGVENFPVWEIVREEDHE